MTGGVEAVSTADAVRHGAAPRRITRWTVLRPLALLAIIVFILWVTGCMERLFYVPTQGPTPPPARPANIQPVDFTSADGTPLHGWFIPASRRDGDDDGAPAPAPTILHVHGNAGCLPNHLPFTDFLPAAGFNLFLFDYRGYGQSGGSATKRDDLIADAHAALDVLLQRDDVDPQCIGLFGQSLGGAIGVNVMAERPEIRCAALVSVFTSWREVAASVVGGDPPNAFGRSLAALLIPDGRRPDEAITRIERPILILHGDADGIVPVGHGRRLAAAGPSARLVELPGADHNTLRETNPEFDDLTIAFFREHLMPANEP